MNSSTEVLYNESCPVCSREVNHYARLTEKAGVAVVYDPLGDPEKLAQWDIDSDDAARRLHVRKDGEVFKGIPAFIVLWREIPQYRWLARLINLPGIHGAMCLLYDHVFAPILYRWHRRRKGVARK